MRQCSIDGRGQGHVNNFYIVDLENFATASHQYTGDIHNSSVVGLFMTPIGQWKRLDRVTVECTCLLHTAPLLPLQLHNFDLFRTCRTSSFCTVAWQLARFPLTRRIAWSSPIAELLVNAYCILYEKRNNGIRAQLTTANQRKQV